MFTPEQSITAKNGGVKVGEVNKTKAGNNCLKNIGTTCSLLTRGEMGKKT
jgi:hypothetical protein